MTIDDQIGDEKIQYDINIEAEKISVLLSGKIDKFEYLTGENILPSNQKNNVTSYIYLFSFGENFLETNKNNSTSGEKNKLMLYRL